MARNLKSGILITGDASGAVKATKLTRDEMAKLNNTTQKANERAHAFSQGLKGMSSFAASSAKTLAGMGAAGSAAMLAIVKSSANAAKEIKVLSGLTGVSAEEFQAQSSAAKTVGVQMDKYADIMKDVQDKVGDFLQNEGGPLKDFFDNIAPQVGVTADQFKNLSGPEALQLYVSSLEKANLSNSEMTFYMEAIASDATLLLPLMKNNAKAFDDLSEAASKTGLNLSNIDVENLSRLDTTIDQISSNFGKMFNIIGAELAPVIQVFADDLLEATGQAGDLRENLREMIRTVLDGVGYLGDFARGLEVAAATGEALGVTLGVGVGLAIDKVTLLGLEFEKIFVEAGAAGERFASYLITQIGELLNDIIDSYNKVAEVVPFLDPAKPIVIAAPDIGPFQEKLVELEAEIVLVNDSMEAGAEQIGAAWQKVGDLMLEELPSEQMKEKLKGVFEEADKVAEESLSSGNSGTVSGAVLDLEQNFSFSMDNMLQEFNSATDKMDKIAEESATNINDALGGVIGELNKQFGGLGDALGGAFQIFQDGGLTSGNALAAGQGVGSFLSGQFGGGGQYADLGNEVGGYLGSALLGPIGGFLGSIGGGILGSFIGGGESDRSQSVQVGNSFITTGGLTGDKFSQENRDIADATAETIRRMFRDIEQETGKALDSIYEVVIGSRDGIDLLKDGVVELNNYKGTAAEVLDTIFLDMLEQAGVTSDVYETLRGENEALVETFERVEAQSNAVNSAVKTLGLNFDAIGDAGLVASDSLIKATGGLDAFIQGTSYFYDNFFTEQEKFNNSLNQFTSTMELAGLEVPKTREEFKNLVLGLDLVNEADQQLYATLIDLAPTANLVYNELEETGAKLSDMGTVLIDLEDPIETVKESVVGVGDAANDASNGVDTLSDSGENLASSSLDASNGINELISSEESLTETRVASERILQQIAAETSRQMSEFQSSLQDPVTGGGSREGIVDRSGIVEWDGITPLTVDSASRNADVIPMALYRAPSTASGSYTLTQEQAAQSQAETVQILQSVARHTARTARVMAKFDYDGLPAERV